MTDTVGLRAVFGDAMTSTRASAGREHLGLHARARVRTPLMSRENSAFPQCGGGGRAACMCWDRMSIGPNKSNKIGDAVTCAGGIEEVRQAELAWLKPWKLRLMSMGQQLARLHDLT